MRHGNSLLVGAALSSVLLVIVACLSAGQPAAPPSGPTPLPISGAIQGVSGKLLYPKEEGFWLLEPRTKARSELARLPERASVGALAASPDGTLVAYSVYLIPAVGDAGGIDLHVMEADGSNQRVVVAHDAPWTSLTDPAWTPDSRSLYFTRRNLEGSERIERINPDGSGGAVVVKDAHSPSVSLDGRWLAYLKTEPETGGNALVVVNADGTDTRRLVGPPDFLKLAAPRFAPDSKGIAFAALQSPQPQAFRRSAPASLFQARPAEAHGLPWDLWLIDVNGTSLRRLTHLGEDSPIATWSPDGKWLAFSTHSGLYVVDVNGGQVWRLAEEPAGGGVAWLSR